MPSNRIIVCRPLLLLPSVFPSIRVSSNESALLIRWPKYWSFSFSISLSSECSGLISFRMDWLDLLAVQGTLKNLLQHHSLKASILWRSAFFIVQLSHPYSTTGKGVFSCSLSTLSRGMFTLVLGPGIELGPSEWGARSLSQWMTREVLYHCISIFFSQIFMFSLSL